MDVQAHCTQAAITETTDDKQQQQSKGLLTLAQGRGAENLLELKWQEDELDVAYQSVNCSGLLEHHQATAHAY